ncbi:serine/threonine-protein phosphatase [Candidatus Poribacteria bacterium]|nr:serine/threonine-protein phosphatase [Candidatus Poribacteria bacterium]
MVADGIGSHDKGREAAGICVSQFVKFLKEPRFQRLKEEGFQEGLNETIAWLILRQMIDTANQLIYEKAVSKDVTTGTTCAAAIVKMDAKANGTGTCFFAHVGDSRIYLINRNEISQLSSDHSLVQHMVDSGSISQEEARHHEQRNIITNFVGIGPQIQIDVGTQPLSAGDVLILSTDGLHNHAMDDEEFLQHLIRHKTPARACKALIKRAKRNGATDNMTLVLIKIPGRRLAQ